MQLYRVKQKENIVLLLIVTTELIEYPTALYSFSKFSINPWITEPKKKLPTLTELDTYFTHIF